MWCVAASVNIDDVLDIRPGGIIRCGGSPAGKVLVSDGQQVRWADPPRRDDLAEQAREHKARMAAEHAETMRQAKVGTWLLLAFVVAAGWAVAQLLGMA